MNIHLGDEWQYPHKGKKSFSYQTDLVHRRIDHIFRNCKEIGSKPSNKNVKHPLFVFGKEFNVKSTKQRLLVVKMNVHRTLAVILKIIYFRRPI